ncbi:MAG: hypothetical protein H0T66_06245 [Geodermatophilaceae bacterium]|nr:hypothetical protein [Geodermatophilaceae bacterium]
MALALSGCGATRGEGPATAAVLPKRDGGPEALTSGVLGGDPDSGCLWLEGPSGDREQILLVGGFEVDWTTDPPRVLQDDMPLVELGEFLHFAGGNEVGDGVPDCPVAPSGSGKLWHAFARFTPPPTE